MISYPLTAAQHGTRVKLEITGSEDIEIQVGDPNETWPDGAYIEVVRTGGTGIVSFVPYDGGVSLNLIGDNDQIADAQYGRVSLVSPGVWDLHTYAPASPNFIVAPHAEIKIFGSSGDVGQILTSDGPGNPAYWADPPSGGGGDPRVHTYSLSLDENQSMDGLALFNNWNASTVHNDPISGFLTYSGLGSTFNFTESGTYKVTLICQVYSDGGNFPENLNAFGAEIVTNGPSVYGSNPSYHHVSSYNQFPQGSFIGLGFGPSPIGSASGVMSWTDTFVIYGAIGGTTTMYINMYGYNYNNTSQTYGASITMMVEKISNDTGS